MAAAKLFPELSIQADYSTWLEDVRSILETMDIIMNRWQDNWEFDFRTEYDRGSTPHIAAVHAHDFWWHHLLAESWT